jgi:hypothetical protein
MLTTFKFELGVKRSAVETEVVLLRMTKSTFGHRHELFTADRVQGKNTFCVNKNKFKRVLYV